MLLSDWIEHQKYTSNADDIFAGHAKMLAMVEAALEGVVEKGTSPSTILFSIPLREMMTERFQEVLDA